MIGRFGLAFLGLIALGAATTVADERPAVAPGCEVPDYLRTLTEGLPHVMQAINRGAPLKVVALGSGSTAGGGVESAARAYPARLEKELARRLKTSPVNVAVKAKPGQTASDMVKQLKTEVLPEKPALVIWQTGTVDAVRGVHAESFAEALVTGIEILHKSGIDVILIDMQYSPYTSSMVHLETYRKLMMWVAQRRDVFMFRRYEVMQYWSENHIFDLGVADRAEQRRVADRVHGCLGQLLADVVLTSWEVARERSP
jgi:hypothetical protein